MITLDDAKKAVALLSEEDARLRLAWVWTTADQAASLHSMDNNDPPHEVEEILAQAEGSACTECGDYRRDYRQPRKHYTHCSKYGEVL